MSGRGMTTLLRDVDSSTLDCLIVLAQRASDAHTQE